MPKMDDDFSGGSDGQLLAPPNVVISDHVKYDYHTPADINCNGTDGTNFIALNNVNSKVIKSNNISYNFDFGASESDKSS